MDDCTSGLCPTALPEGVFKQDCSDGTIVLHAPIGCEDLPEQCFKTHVQCLNPFFETIVDLENTQVAFQLLRNCFGVCKIGYLLRVSPPSCTAEGAAKFDGII